MNYNFENRFFLVLEKRPGDYMNININLLDLNFSCSNTIHEIDYFTSQYKCEEIKEAIQKANIVPENYLAGRLLIIDDAKRTYFPLTKDYLDGFNLTLFIKENINDISITNSIFNYYSNICKDLESNQVDLLKSAISSKNYLVINQILNNLPYLKYRALGIYAKNKLEIKVKNKELLREKLQ